MQNVLILRRGHPLLDGQRRADGTLLLFSEVLAAPQRDWPAGAVPCGFPFPDALQDQERDPALERFLEQGPPPIAFTLGSAAPYAGGGDLFSTAVAAVRSIGLRAVLLAGPRAEALGVLPPEFLVLRSAPYRRVFAACAAVVHAGGIGACAEGLRAGRPQVAILFNHDAFDNGARLERLGVAVPLSRAHVTLEGLARALTHALGAETVRRAEALAGRVRAEDGVARACDRIEAILPGGRPRQRPATIL